MPAAIAATTETLWQLLDGALRTTMPGVKVNACPPDRIRKEGGARQINLSLFQVTAEATRSDLSVRQPTNRPLAVTLHYLLSAYGDEGDGLQLAAHEVLGEAMRVLHENPVLPRVAADGAPLSALHVALQTISLDDMHRLWGSWQTPYRVSVVYEVSPVFLGAVS